MVEPYNYDVDTANSSDVPPSWKDLKFEPTKKVEFAVSSNDADALKAVLGKHEDDFLPWEDVMLPSLGLYYGDKLPGGIVQVRAMGINAEKILATQRLAQSGKALEFLFKHCVRLPTGLDPLDLLLGDRTFLLYYLRGITHGNEYEFTFSCTNEACKRDSIHKFDLNNLRGTIKAASAENGPEPFRIVLPHMSEIVKRDFWIKIRLMRGRDGIAVRKNIDKKRKLDPNALDETIIKNLSTVVVEIMGSTDRTEIDNIIDKLHARDHAYIRDKLDELSPTIDTEVTVPCAECGNIMKVDLPITEDFFRPSKSV